MIEIRITPLGHLRLEDPAHGPESTALASLQKVFGGDWREGLFVLAAEKIDPAGSTTLRYWRDLSERYVTGLCHIPESSETIEIDALSEADCATFILTAPPMRGGEYLSPETLLAIWESLDAWVREAVVAAGGLKTFLENRAEKWRQVGRVCFHLAENKRDKARPFAFMSSYTAGFGAGGRIQHLPLRKALEQYAGAKNRSALVKLLSPIQQASKNCDWVADLVESGEIYQPMAWTPRRAYQLLRSASTLEESGLSVRLPNWWKKRARPLVAVTIGAEKKSVLGVKAMLDFRMSVALGEETLSREEIETLLEDDQEGLVQFKGQWIEVDRDKLRAAIDHWDALQKGTKNGEISFIEGMRLLAGASTDLKHENQMEVERPWLHVAAGEAMRDMLASMRDPSHMDAADLGDGLRATLRPYQRDGLAWLRFLTDLGLGACLADDMGLGKTIQTLALLELFRRENRNGKSVPSLLLVPASLLGNWRDEATRFAPFLRLLFLHPSEIDRKEMTKIGKTPQKRLADIDLVVTTYSMLSRQEWLTEEKWRLVILDEAQAIKNPTTKQTRSVKKLTSHARIALTGTPVENRLGDLWSLFDFLNPGLLGSASVFKTFIKDMETRERDQFAPLRRLAGPYILRRLKTDRTIISDLPEKTETSRYCNLTKAQVSLYTKTVRAMETALKSIEESDENSMARRGLVLQTLMRLKQICNHPSQFSGDADYKPSASGKFLRLAEICDELAERQEKVLIFTQFREIIDPLAEHLAGIFGRQGLVLHGGTSIKKRKALVDQFQEEDGPPFFILSLKAGGTGLNLTAASHVIHFDRWWNPAVETQATDRAFRIGQKRNVLVYKFVVRGTIEERIDAMIAEKKKMAEEVLSGEGEVKLTELPDDELLNLVRLDVSRAAI